MSEKPPSFENKESIILNYLLETIAGEEGMTPDDILSDILTFAELSEEDEDAKAYLEELAEKLDTPVDVLVEYAREKSDGS